MISSYYTMLQEKDEKIVEKEKEENVADKEETPEKNQDKKKKKVESDDATEEDDDELFKDVDSSMEDDATSDTPEEDTSTDEADSVSDDLDSGLEGESDDSSDTSTDTEEIPSDDTSTDDGLDGEEEPVEDTDPEFIKIKNTNKKKKLLADYISLYEFYGRLIYKMDSLKNLSPEETKTIDEALLRLNSTKKILFDYIQTMYMADSYERALSMYFNFKLPINFTEEIITKIAEKRNNT